MFWCSRIGHILLRLDRAWDTIYTKIFAYSLKERFPLAWQVYKDNKEAMNIFIKFCKR